ncbi:tRNA (N6-threonylcarbamoyladenosine(37)-N6)-methyltransferase TrmO [Shewanella intestini]|uniref:tRNA (N6-threonylcarbamoyladenosine(37)-N6)-methyltransferase TrmO n=1 Tax=Shewanella intestini TaxID=2017544 RepID=A0ABS5I071_9GAMM|nr:MULTISPECIES: tRNA (N6-threonylcarbamoyladenosine(37)-N6)-methyltransferase TrmO [Shewanella]MBR9727407.1 tRNA (N6-threonylcarbamoyladenosine(37)-N6)-methyltransferase TrmO [Shewanella intestini]MRG35543.1 tRNA (N6-threonylcarbamoyladenosine(37)-N6)-methyltransferase TrmO [Shewanella sp. XMDDZSB0408]
MTQDLFSTQIEAVAVCHTPYKQKFGIPRQPGLVDARGFVELIGQFNHLDTVRGIEQYSHLWLVFCFHENLAQGWKTTVRPPRLGGNEKLGVFATRATFRPNGLGQSVVKLHQVIYKNGKVMLEISGMDLVDNTPIIDIKPYIPFSDAINSAQGGMAQDAPILKPVSFTELALAQISQYEQHHPQRAGFEQLIEGVLAQDPRPAYKKAKADPKRYQVALYDRDIFWHVDNDTIFVTEIVPTTVV